MTYIKIAGSLLLGLLLAQPTSADEPFGVQLFHPDSLIGWEYGDGPSPSGWKITDGRLESNHDSAPLLSGYSFGDFELRFQWSVSKGGAWKITLPNVPNGDPIELIFREGDGCGQITEGGKTLTSGARLEPIQDAMHQTIVRRADGKLSVSVDDNRLAEIDIRPERRLGLGLAVVDGTVTLDDMGIQEPAGEPIHNGTDHTGWWCPGNLDAWKCEEGEMVLSNRGGNYIRTEKLFGNYTLSLEYKIKKSGNSGIGIRTPRDGWPSGDGMELQLLDRPLDHPLDKHQTMAIYGNMPPLTRADLPDVYNRVVIKADGWMISAWVNGQLVQHTNTLHHPELKHRNLKGWIGFQDHGAWIRLRNIRLLEAPDGEGLDAWHQPPPARATAALLDRLMNTGRLSSDDGIRSAVAIAPPCEENTEERILAELTGPGAIVRIARSNDAGQLAFYFDGEEIPRLECTPGELSHVVPHVAGDKKPVLTCLTYRKSLKVVLQKGDAESAYRFDYVHFPDEMMTESFVSRESGFPRGWISALTYRHHQGNLGTVRNHAPTPLVASESKAIAPGANESMVDIEGSGVVRWVRLRAPRTVLESNALWLEVHVDGEPNPAVAAPVRFWYPGFTAKGRYHNFVLFDRDGMLNRLAMPFGDGIRVSLHNRGAEPSPDVSVELSVERPTEANREEMAKRMRLRGVFTPRGDEPDSREMFCIEGQGRWVGLVSESSNDEPIGFDSLSIDSKPVDGWGSIDRSPFLGTYGDFRRCLSGRVGPLTWRYLLLAPVDFEKSLVLSANRSKLGDRWALFYIETSR